MAPLWMNSAAPISAPVFMPRDAKYKSTANRVMPIEPNGTRPISIRWPDNFSQRTEPRPIPTENVASSSVTTCSFPDNTSLAKPVNEVRKIEPKNHNQEIPIIDRNTARLRLAIFRLAQVSVNGFQLILRPGSGAGDGGMKPAATLPNTAATSDTVATQVGPTSGSATSAPPSMVPSRIATNVPISTRPLPPVSSESCKCWGR